MMDATVLLGIIAALVALLFIVRSAREAMQSGDLKKLLDHPAAGGDTPLQTHGVETRGLAEASDPDDAIAAGHLRWCEYLALVSNQARTSFLFSLVFASLGFILLASVALFPAVNTGGSALVQLMTGIILVGASGLLFNRVRDTHRSICESLEKLKKRDRHLKSRELCESVGDEKTRDALRVQLALHYAGVSRALETTKAITRLPLSDN